MDTKSTCCYCGVGCGVIIETTLDSNNIPVVTGVRGDPDHPANFGRLCTKGSTLHLTATPHLQEQLRLASPLLRVNRHQNPDEIPKPISWENAEDLVAQKFAKVIKEHGPDSVAIYVSGQILTEDYYVFNKLAKGLMGTNNIDTNSRLCMSSAVAGYKQTLGMDAPPCSYEDIEKASVLFITGSNTAFAHPILYRRIEDARAKNPSLKMIVVDPRKTDTAREADLFLQILPGTDVALYHGMLHIMMWEHWIDEKYIASYTEGFDALKQLVRDYTPKAVADICGISEADLFLAAKWFACSAGTVSLYCQGLNQSASGTAKNATLINLHLACAQIGKEGAGPFSLTGQPNAMGGREVGGLANLLSAHRNLASSSDRAEIAQFWGVNSVPDQPGLTAVPMFNALLDKKVKAIWIVCTNPAQSLPNQQKVHEALAQAEFVVVQEAYQNTATCGFADVLLPATTWAEKVGSVTNSERRISLVRPAVPAFSQARHDWQIAVNIAQKIERLLPNNRIHSEQSLFAYHSVEEIWNEHRETTRGRDLDITGLSYAILEKDGPQQWPMPEGAMAGKKRLYEDGRYPTPNGRAKFMATPYTKTIDSTNARYPISLNTGRLRDQWHGMSRTGTLGTLFAHAPKPCVEISRRDAHLLDLSDGDLAHITSRQGSEIFPVKVSEDIAVSQAFIAMHWGCEFISGNAGKKTSKGVNGLTTPEFDPVSCQPELKHAAVKILKANLPWKIHAFAYFSNNQAMRSLESLRKVLPYFGSAYLGLFGREQERQKIGIELNIAHEDNPFTSEVPEIKEAVILMIKTFGFDDSQGVLKYQDKRIGTNRFIKISECVDSVLLAGTSQQLMSATWLKQYLEDELDPKLLGRMILSPSKIPPIQIQNKGKIICNCFNVSEQTILKTIKDSATDLNHEQVFHHLQKITQCSSNCGSCKPEIKRMIEENYSNVLHA